MMRLPSSSSSEVVMVAKYRVTWHCIPIRYFSPWQGIPTWHLTSIPLRLGNSSYYVPEAHWEDFTTSATRCVRFAALPCYQRCFASIIRWFALQSWGSEWARQRLEVGSHPVRLVVPAMIGWARCCHIGDRLPSSRSIKPRNALLHDYNAATVWLHWKLRKLRSSRSRSLRL